MSKFSDALKKVGILEDKNTLNEKTIKIETQSIVNSNSNSDKNQSYVGKVIDINQIYEKEGLGCLDSSILKVEDFLVALPQDLPDSVKKQTILGILKATKLEVSDLIVDAQKRIALLRDNIQTVSIKTSDVINENNTEIENLQIKIEMLQQQIIHSKAIQVEQEQLINKEIESIQKIITFIE